MTIGELKDALNDPTTEVGKLPVSTSISLVLADGRTYRLDRVQVGLDPAPARRILLLRSDL